MTASNIHKSTNFDKGCPINAANQMPINLTSYTLPSEALGLSTERQISSIPRSTTDEKEEESAITFTTHSAHPRWVYPSEQMFYAALHRKGNAPSDPESTIPTILAIHNYLNETVWRELMTKWESNYLTACATGQQPRLKRFAGRPGVWSPRAFLAYIWSFGKVKPFDRHDWIVERCGGHEVRYVIDYYGADDEEKEEASKVTKKVPDGRIPINSQEKEESAVFYVDIRPALDSFQAFRDRLYHWWHG